MVKKQTINKIPDNQIAFYQTLDGSVNIEVLYAAENIWLTQKKIAELFDTTPQNITQHLKNIYAEGETDPKSTCKDFLQVQQEGNREIKRNTAMYSLEAIIAVGYRVNSERGTQFRQWATGGTTYPLGLAPPLKLWRHAVGLALLACCHGPIF